MQCGAFVALPEWLFAALAVRKLTARALQSLRNEINQKRRTMKHSNPTGGCWMSTSYETLELIASHHAEVERLCEELLDLGSRIKPGDPELYVLRENARALAWRLREHLAIESSALMADAGANPAYEKALLVYRDERERLDRAW